MCIFFFSSRRRHTRSKRDWSSDVCSSDLLVHIDQPEAAERVHNGWLKTLEEGVHTYDVYTEGQSKQKVGTKEFADAVIARMGKTPQTLKAAKYSHRQPRQAGKAATAQAAPRTQLVSIDLFLEWPSRDPNQLAQALRKVNVDGLPLSIISNRGLKVWPD